MNTFDKLALAHRLIMQAAAGPSLALVKNKGNRTALRESIELLKSATSIIEGIVGDD